jgi:hypothetical protein
MGEARNRQLPDVENLPRIAIIPACAKNWALRSGDTKGSPVEQPDGGTPVDAARLQRQVERHEAVMRPGGDRQLVFTDRPMKAINVKLPLGYWGVLARKTSGVLAAEESDPKVTRRAAASADAVSSK